MLHLLLYSIFVTLYCIFVILHVIFVITYVIFDILYVIFFILYVIFLHLEHLISIVHGRGELVLDKGIHPIDTGYVVEI